MTYTVFKGTDKEFTGSLKEIAEHFGIEPKTLSVRACRGLTLEEAIEKPVRKRLIKTTVFKGTDKEFTGSILEISNHFKINRGTLENRIMRGMTLEEAIEMPVINNEYVVTIFPKTDKEFTGNLREIANHFGINHNTLSTRIRLGMTLEEAIKKPISKSEIITVFKETDKEFSGNLKEIANHFEINYLTFLDRIKSGMTPEESIEKPVYKNIKTITVFKGSDIEFTGNLKEIAKHFGVNYETFKGRIVRSKMSTEEAIEKSIVKNIKTITVYKDTDKEFTGNLREIADHFGINYESLGARVRSGMTTEEAIERPVNHINIRIITIYKNTDKEFTGNFKEIADHFGINYNAFKSRIYYGMTPEEAIEVPMTKVHQNNLAYKVQTGNLKELCKLFNKNYTEVYNLLKYNHTLEYAMQNVKATFKEE